MSSSNSNQSNMVPTVEELIDTLQKFSDRIDLSSEKAKEVADFSQELFKTVKLTKEYNKELKVLNNRSNKKSRISLISSMGDEKKTIKDLQSENKELESVITHHKQVLGIIMAKYRQQNVCLGNLNICEESYQVPNDILLHRYNYFRNRSLEIIPLIYSGCVIDETEIMDQQRLIIKLEERSNRIKKLLNVKKD